MSYEFEKEEMELKGCILTVQFEVTDYSIANSGIGAYEFWGAKGYDRGVDFVEEFVIGDVYVWSERRNKFITLPKKNKQGKPAKLYKAIVDKLYNDDWMNSHINETIMDDLNSEPDCPDC